MEIKLKGETLEGTFRGRLMSKKGWAGSEYTERECTYCWYEGCGIIRKEDNQYFFSFRTPSRESGYEENLTLENSLSLIHFGGRYIFNEGSNYLDRIRKRVIPERHPQLIDFALSDFLSQVKTSKEDIPLVIPKALKLDDLIERGLCYEDNGQVRMALG
ncbi:MAG: hypothetical protein AABY26_02375 [Nanoarchaeota archaeon]